LANRKEKEDPDTFHQKRGRRLHLKEEASEGGAKKGSLNQSAFISENAFPENLFLLEGTEYNEAL